MREKLTLAGTLSERLMFLFSFPVVLLVSAMLWPVAAWDLIQRIRHHRS